MKKWYLLFILLISSYLSVSANSIKIMVDGSELVCDPAAYLYNDRVLVPVRAISEAFAFNVDWNEANQLVTISNSDTEIKLWIDSKTVIVNNTEQTVDVAPMIKDGRTFVPIRLVSESLDKDVFWADNTVNLFSKWETMSEQTTVEVATTAELLKEIGSNKRILLKDGVYNLTKETGNKDIAQNASWEEVFDGIQLVIRDVSNLTIEGIGDKTAEIVVEPRYANVLSFYNSHGITLKNLEMGHTPEQGSCAGGVVFIVGNGEAVDLMIDNCILYGCGTMGLYAENAKNISVTNSIIEECTSSVISLRNASFVFFKDCVFRNSILYIPFDIVGSKEIYFDNCEITDNVSEVDYYSFFRISQSKKVNFINCIIANNTGVQEPSLLKDVYFENCTVKNNNFDEVFAKEKYDVPPITLDDYIFEGIAPDITKEAVLTILSDPLKTGEKTNKKYINDATDTVMAYADMEVGLSSAEKVVSLKITDPSIKTARQIGIGSNKEVVHQKYGYPHDTVSDYYIYELPSPVTDEYSHVNYTRLYFVFENDVIVEMGLETYIP